jgi:sugar O-acyltransferase (sialic acid O-acetyltransferase NeuD family)
MSTPETIMKKLGIIGSGDLAKQVLHIANLQNTYRVIGYFDDFHLVGSQINGSRILGGLSDIDRSMECGEIEILFSAVGYNSMANRKSVFDRFSKTYPYAIIIHPHSYVDTTASIGQGSIIYPGVLIDKSVWIGENVVLNNGCIISHDSRIGAHSFLAPNVAIAGNVEIGERVFLGISTTVIDRITIASDVQTGVGCGVIKNIECSGTYIGCPAKRLR